MPKGKKTDNLTVYKVMLSYFSTNNFEKTARELNMPATTVEAIYKRNKDKEEFVKLQKEKTEEFIENADRIIKKATTLLEKKLDIALNNQDELDDLIQDIYNADKSEIKEQQKKSLVKKVMRMQLNALNEITTAIGTMYDKRALAKGDNTSNVGLNADKPFDVKITVVK